MKAKKNLVLLGMMGSGKSTIGLLISKKLNIKFVDVDNVIEKNMNMPISEIFKVKGEGNRIFSVSLVYEKVIDTSSPGLRLL